MEDIKKEVISKQKRSKSDLIKHAVLSYLQRRNYPVKGCHKLSLQEFEIDSLVKCEVSRPNSILYSCFNSDPIVIDQTFIKFINWLKDLHKIQDDHELDSLTVPLFCHLYFEILRGGHVERAANFFTSHLQAIDRFKTNHVAIELINAIVNNSPELTKLKENFRSHKFSITLSTSSVKLLKQFLSESAHIVLLHVLQNYFKINEMDKSHNINNDIYDSGIESACHKNTKPQKVSQELFEAIAGLTLDSSPIYLTNLHNVKDNITCGLMKRQYGICLYCCNNSLVVRSLVTLKQLDGTDFLDDVILTGHRKRIYDISFVNNLKYILSASEDETIRLFDLNEYSEKNIYRGHEYPVYCVDSSVNNQYFVSGSYDHTARLWVLTRKDALRVYAGHTQEITSVTMHLNCTFFATGSADKNIRLWTVGNNMPVRLFLSSKGTVYSLTFNNKGNYLLSSNEDKKVRIWDLVAGKKFLDFETGSELVTHLSLSNDDKILITGTSDGSVKYWNFEELTKNGNNKHYEKPFNQFSLNSKLLDIEYSFDTVGFLTHQ